MSSDNQVQTSIKSNDLIEANIKIIGDTSTVADIVKLLSYIRHSIKNRMPYNINVEVGKRVNSDFFDFSVNNSEIRDYITMPSININ